MLGGDGYDEYVHMLIMGCNSHNQFVFKTMQTPVKLDVNIHYFNELFLANINWDQIGSNITRRKIRNEQNTYRGLEGGYCA